MIKSAKRIRRKDKELELATEVEDAVTWIECSEIEGRTPLKTGWAASEESVTAVDWLRKLFRVEAFSDPEDATRVPGLGIWCTAAPPWRYEAAICERVAFSERQRLRNVGVLTDVNSGIVGVHSVL